MKVYVRHEEDADSNYLTAIDFRELHLLITAIKDAGGFYDYERGESFQLKSYQLVNEQAKAYCEIIYGGGE